jgi:hypothetical protein
MTGFVCFVSSGAGDPELLTLNAVARLQAADAVLFDDLSSGPILEHVRTGTDLVSVGKRAGRVSPRRHHVSRLLVDYATTHAKVVPLKSGDAGIFGRLEEEIRGAVGGRHRLRNHARRHLGLRRGGYGRHTADPATQIAAGAIRHRPRRHRRTYR